jgi:hypothetical protein
MNTKSGRVAASLLSKDSYKKITFRALLVAGFEEVTWLESRMRTQ